MCYEFSFQPSRELREQIVPEIRELVRQQRLSQLVEGLMFDQISKRGQQKGNVAAFYYSYFYFNFGTFYGIFFLLLGYWFCCLSPNHRFLHYGEVSNNKVNPPIDSLPNKSKNILKIYIKNEERNSH